MNQKDITMCCLESGECRSSKRKIHLKTIYILALFPTGSLFTLKSSCLVLLSPASDGGVLSHHIPLLKVVVLRNFPPLDLGEASIVQIDVQWRLWHPYGEDSSAHILWRAIFDVNLSGQSPSAFRPINVDGGAGGCHLKN